jgi:protein-S-isoprenylcysteine O-methyltransferase Ste14
LKVAHPLMLRAIAAAIFPHLRWSCRNMRGVSDHVQPRRKRSVCLALLAPFAYQGIALCCLRHWGSATPWSDLDLFSGSFIALTALLLMYETPFKRGIFRSRETLREASGLSYDPATVVWGSALAVGDLSVFLDYGHWHLTPALRQPGLQITGLALYACAMAGLMWTNTCLVRHFQGDLNHRQLMTTGPFAAVRHPRYASLLLAKLGFSLILASILAWISMLASILLIRRRIRLEELYLREVFGPKYSSYTERTPCLIPGIY